MYKFDVTISGVHGEYGIAIVKDGFVASALAYVSQGGLLSVNTLIVCYAGENVYVEVNTKTRLQYFSKASLI